MFFHKFITKLSFLLTIFSLLSACSGPASKVVSLYDDVISDVSEYEIICPKVKFIEGMDIIKFTQETKYEVTFYEVKWKCYTYGETEETFTDINIDLSIKFKIDYKDSNEIFKEEKFSLILALLNDNNEVIIKNKFNKSFLNKEKSEIINNDNGIINIKLKRSHRDMTKYLLLLGFTQ
jgi:hypothetical protein